MARDPVRDLRVLAKWLQPQLRSLGASLPDALRLLRRDRETLSTWARRVRAVESTLGASEAHAYTGTLLQALARDVPAARLLARELPDLLAQIPAEQRSRFVALVRAVLADSPGAAPMVASALPRLLQAMDDHSLSDFVAQGVALFGHSQRRAASFLSLETRRSRSAATALQRGTGLLEVHRVLTHYARAHCGAQVRVRPGGERAYSDGRHIYLPTRVEAFDDPRDVQVYRVLTAWAAGFIEFGSLDVTLEGLPGDWPSPRPQESDLERFFRSFPNSAIAKELYALLEGARVQARVRAEYPGVARQMDALGPAWRPPRPVRRRDSPVQRAMACVTDTVTGGEVSPLSGPEADAARTVLDMVGELSMDSASALDVMGVVQRAVPVLYALLELATPTGQPSAEFQVETSSSGLDLSASRDEPDRTTAYLTSLLERPELPESDSDGRSYEEMAEFLDKLEAPAGPMRDEAEAKPTAGRPPGESRLAGDGITRVGAIRYPEWDHRIEDHRAGWVQLTEYRLEPAESDFVDQIRQTYGPLVTRLRRSFEALRPVTPERRRGLTDGDELDMDRVVEARVARKASGVSSDQLYQRRMPQRRDVAVAFLVDLSSSTNEVANQDGKRIIDVEREALVLAAEAVDAIGDDCAIYGYSGYGRDQVAFYIAKDFTDPWDDRVRRRVGRMSWKMENRDGAAIRHAARKLMRHPAKTRLIINLSDGKPLDCGCDTYTDTYAQEDTRAALQEARQMGVHAFCITVDPHGRDYLSQMYGEHGYTIIDRVELLPERLPAVYRRLTR